MLSRTSPNNNSHILILGHTGFIGKNLMKYLERKLPEVEIVGKSSGDIDLTSDKCTTLLENCFLSNTILVILSGIKRQFGDSIDNFEKNLKMIENVCRALSNKKIGRVIYFSSVVVYGEDIPNLAITEETQIIPRTYYALAKYASEQLLLMEVKKEIKNLLILRPTTVYGPGDTDDTYGPEKFTNAAINNNKIELWGDGSEYRDFIYIDDLLEIFYRLICKNSKGIFNIATGKSYSFRDVIAVVESISGVGLDIRTKLRTKDKADNKYNIIKLSNEIDNYTFTPLNKGIERLYYELMKDNRKG